MGILQRFENRLEQMVSGVFAKAFRSAVQPVEIAAALQREVDNSAQILSRNRRLVPNQFHVELSGQDHERLAPYSSTLAQELTEMLREHAHEQAYVFTGPVTISFDERDDLSTGRFRVRSAALAKVTPVSDRSVTDTAVRRATVILEVNGMRHPLDPPGIVIGRGTEADLRINDPGVSRRHAEIRVHANDRTGTDVSVVDLGSTNGMLVNGHKVKQATLDDGGHGQDRQHHDDGAFPARGGGWPMSELTLMLIRFAYLAILWIFVLSAISVIRSDMFGARIESTPRADRRAEKQARKAQSSRADQAAARRPDPRRDRRGRQRGRDRLPRRGADPDRPRLGRRDPARRRLRLHPARPDRELGRPVVRRGPRLHQRHLHRLPPAHPAHHAPARQQGPDRQDHPRAEEVGPALAHGSHAPRGRRRRPPRRCGRPASPAALRRAVRRRAGPQGQPGLRLRQRAPAGHRRRRGRRGARRRRQQRPPCKRCAGSTSRRPTDMLEALAGAIHRAHDRIAELVEQDPELDGTSTTVTAALFDGNRIGLAHIGDSRGYLLRDGTLSQLTKDHTFVQSLIDEGRITEEEARTHPHRNLILRAVDGVHETDPDLFYIELAPGDRLLLCSDGASGVLDHDRLADILGTGSVDYAVVELIRASLEAGSSDNITCVVADVVEVERRRRRAAARRGRHGTDAGRRRRGAAAPRRARRPRASSAATAAATPARSSRCRARRTTGDARSTPRSCATHRRHRAAAAGSALAALLVRGARARAGRRSLGYRWSQSQYYVAADGDQVAIYRGVQADMPGV